MAGAVKKESVPGQGRIFVRVATLIDGDELPRDLRRADPAPAPAGLVAALSIEL